VCAAIEAGIFNDLGSGSNVDACVITAERTETLRNYKTPNERAQKELTYKFRRGTTAWKKESVRNLIVDEQIREVPPITAQGGDAMDTS
jgi:20S proteasome subunit beta 2